jgi:eukaryotic-like serine/threonine-protein kinase
MGEVYAAYDPELDRKVAVKLLRASTNDALGAGVAKSRLLREAQAIARLSHPNVIVVHDVGSFGDQVFVAMEFVEGYTVAYWLHASPRTWQEILSVFRAAGRGLAAAHEAQTVHRDFKAENVMLGHDGQARVMDFGLARQLSERPAVSLAPIVPAAVADEDLQSTRQVPVQQACEVGDPLEAKKSAPIPTRLAASPGNAAPEGRTTPNEKPTDLTQTGFVMGTPAFMAPEVFAGHLADARSDQFSFCVALYEALYGEHPFGGNNMTDLADNVTRGKVRPPPETTRVPGWVRRVLLRGLQVAPEMRWPTMDPLLAALDRGPRTRGWWYGALSAAALSTTLAVSLFRGSARRPSCRVPEERFSGVWEPANHGGRRKAIGDAMRASGKPYAEASFAGLTRLLDRYVDSWSAMYRDACEATNIRGEQSSEVLDLRMSCLRDRWNELRALSDVLVEGQTIAETNAVAAATALTPIDRCAEVGSLRSRLAPPAEAPTRQRVEVLRNQLVEATALENAGHYTRALDATVKVVTEAEALGYRPLIAESLSRRAMLRIATGQAAEADADFEQALWLAEASSHDELVAQVAIEEIFVSGYLLHDMPRFRRWVSQAQAFMDRIGGHEQLRGWMLNNIGAVLDADGQHEAALERFSMALQIKERALGKDHPDVGLTLGNLADALHALGRSAEALDFANRGVEIIERAFGPGHPDMVILLVNRAEILNQLGRYEDAQRDAHQAVTIERESGLRVTNLVYGLLPEGEAELGLGRPERAVPTLRRALELAEEGDLEPELPRVRFALARALWDSGGDRKRAIALAALVAHAKPHAEGKDAGGHDDQLRRRAASWLTSRKGSDDERHRP